MEEILAAFRDADLTTQQTLVRLVDGLVNELDEVTENDAARIVAAVRGLCGSRPSGEGVRRSEMVQELG
jgi:hypothetical protein